MIALPLYLWDHIFGIVRGQVGLLSSLSQTCTACSPEQKKKYRSPSFLSPDLHTRLVARRIPKQMCLSSDLISPAHFRARMAKYYVGLVFSLSLFHMTALPCALGILNSKDRGGFEADTRLVETLRRPTSIAARIFACKQRWDFSANTIMNWAEAWSIVSIESMDHPSFPPVQRHRQHCRSQPYPVWCLVCRVCL